MARVENSLCDGCGKILLGKDRTATVSEDYLAIKGSISLQLKGVPETNHRRHYLFITEESNDERFFCDVKCLQEYINTRKVISENRRKEALMREANQR